jgi:hypothetical protein
MAAVFGGVAAGASMWLAQRGETRPIGGPREHDGLHAGPEAWEAEDVAPRARVAARRPSDPA